MRIAVIGTGYVGLVTATCLAESGNDVVGIDKDSRKIETLEAGRLPIYEPGLLELVQRNRREERLSFTTDLAKAVARAQVIFVAVGTPQLPSGAADLSSVWAVADTLGEAIQDSTVVVIKSTVPVGTNRTFAERLAARCRVPVDVASNPEFLKEGAAVDDFMKPDRVVVGVRRPEAAKVLQELYAPFLRTERPFLVMSPESAEMTKYVANAMLATKISFINEMANLCERLGADVNDVRRGIGHDARIGFQFLFPGAGYGGSCFEGNETVFVEHNGRVVSETLAKAIHRALHDRAPHKSRKLALVATGPSASGEHDTSPRQEWACVEDISGLRVLAFDLEKSRPVLAPVKALTKRPYRGTMVTLHTSMGRMLRVTADHPIILQEADGFRILPANEVKVGNQLAALCSLPKIRSSAALDLIELLCGTELEADVHVTAKDGAISAQYDQFAAQIPTEALRHPLEIKYGNRMPLRLFRRLRTQGLVEISPDNLQLYTAKGSATKINAVIPVDADLLRLCGYYLAEGFISCDHGRAGAVRHRVGFSFHEEEAEYINDVQRILQRWGLKFITRNGTTATSTIVSSRIFAWVLRDVLCCGTRSEDKALPWLAFSVSAELRHELLRGAFSGDGTVTPVQNGRNFMLEYATVSKLLADGIVLLMQSLEIVPSVRRRWMNKSKRLAYLVRVSGRSQLAALRDIFGEKHRAKINHLLDGYQRHIRQRGFERSAELARLTVRAVDQEEVDSPVFSLETTTGTVIAGSGLICHNCFPKDVRSMLAMARDLGAPLNLLEAVDRVNEAQKRVLFAKIKKHYGDKLKEKTLAIWGLAFKPRTDDIREAPSLALIDALLAEGVALRVHDPEAMPNVRFVYGDRVVYCDRPYGTLEGADGLAIVTEWQEFRHPDFAVMRRLLRAPVIFDGRNLYEPKAMSEAGFTYYSIGR
jgi:UDPglucose 6-dehydrogenase